PPAKPLLSSSASSLMRGRRPEAVHRWSGERRFTAVRGRPWGSLGEDRRHYGRLPSRLNPVLAGVGDERRARELKAAAAGAEASAFLRTTRPARAMRPPPPRGHLRGPTEERLKPRRGNPRA